MSEPFLNSSRKVGEFPRGKTHRETGDKVTVGVYLPKNLVQKAKKQGLNLSRIFEEALSSILAFTEAQNNESSKFLSRGSFQKESRAGSSVWMNAALARRRSGVQIPPGPLPRMKKHPTTEN